MKMTKTKKWIFITLGVILLGLAIFVYFHFFFVFGDGVKTGQLNYVVRKGYVFKTYEGKLIQSGFRSKQANSMGSNEFTFSISNKEVAEKLMRAGGHEVELRYKEYLGTLPWRGYSKYVVDEIINIKNANPSVNESAPPFQTGE